MIQLALYYNQREGKERKKGKVKKNEVHSNNQW